MHIKKIITEINKNLFLNVLCINKKNLLNSKDLQLKKKAVSYSH